MLDKPVRSVRFDPDTVSGMLNQLDRHEAGDILAEEKRASPRYAHRVPAMNVEIKQLGAHEFIPHLVTTRNLSQGGVSFVCGMYLHEGTRCIAYLVDLTGRTHPHAGTVVNCRYLQLSLHEVSVSFDKPIDPERYCRIANPPSTASMEADHVG